MRRVSGGWTGRRIVPGLSVDAVSVRTTDSRSFSLAMWKDLDPGITDFAIGVTGNRINEGES
ncbi:hypothetical protein AOE01nite_24740 [Acetobacter oeni]|uniref:Uncharacterized protein n=1 Tax=Acetobacter oeni TaxID=304077 RepID=A0A511XMT4_9PROT|nr:hypothetical protein AA21952_0541 [Acetobacter oeni LMG 21952]GEN64250.1 hypothetical protein AOE01nite_24740 [Acetobacter oeni]